MRSFVPPLFCAVAALLVELVFRAGHETVVNNYVLLADAWLHGHAWVAYTNPAVDVVPFHGRAYVVEGPAPALLLVPAVALLGTNASQALLANLGGALAAFALYRLCVRDGLAPLDASAATAFGFFGTSLFACATRGDVWFVAHVFAFASSVLALEECLGRGRAWLVALYALVAAFSRYPLVLVLPLYAVVLGARGGALRRVATYACALVPGFALSAWYNFARWRTLGDPGYAIWYRTMDERSHFGLPVFSLRYVPMQLAHFVLRPPKFDRAFPFVTAPLGGFSVFVTSLPFAYGALAGKSRWTVVLAAAALATAIPAFTYYDSGQVQYGMRHALDFEPFLFALLVRALARRPSPPVTVALFAFAGFGAIEGAWWLVALYRS